jgi:exonuclease VII small subunit
LSDFDAPTGTPNAHRLPSHADAARRIAALTDLCDEYQRFTSYAHAAQAHAIGEARRVGEMVQRAQRTAAFAGNLSERNGADLAGASYAVEAANAEVLDARGKVVSRLDSLERALDSAERALQSWNIARARSVDARERSTHRLAAAIITQRRLRAVVAARAEASSMDLQRAQRDLTHATIDVVDFEAEIESADELIERYDRAVAVCETATRIAQEAVDRQRACRQLIVLAQDHVDVARSALKQTAETLRGQREAAGSMTEQTVLAVRADEHAGRLLTAANSAYEDAQHHASETRRHLREHVEQLRWHASAPRNGFHYA